MKRIPSSILLFFVSLLAFGQGVTGDWSGTLSVGPQSLRLVFHITQTDDGYAATMDSPDQGAKGIAMSHVTFTDNILTVELRVAGISFKGKPEGPTIKGTFSQAGKDFPLLLTKSVEQHDTALATGPTGTNKDNPTQNREKIEAENAFLTETLVQITINTGVLKGTLTLPKTFQKGTIALIIAGSGPTDRDGNNPTMRCDTYKQMAHALAKAGIASLRYDKRGIAQSAATVEREEDLSFDLYVNDAKAWMKWAKKDTRFTQRVIIGHSEGSMIGMLATEEADKFISIAGPGRPAHEVLKEQLMAAPNPFGDKALLKVDSLAAGFTVTAASNEEMMLFRPSVQPYLRSWFKYDPRTVLAAIKKPILLLQGGTDIQVPVEDAKRLAAAQPNAKLVILEGMNHVLKSAPLDRASNLATYNKPEWPLTDGLMEAITTFILHK